MPHSFKGQSWHYRLVIANKILKYCKVLFIIYLFVCLFVYMFIYLFVYLFIYLFISFYFFLFIYLCIHLFIYSLIHLLTYLLPCLFVCLFVCLFFIYLFTTPRDKAFCLTLWNKREINSNRWYTPFVCLFVYYSTRQGFLFDSVK